MKWNYFTVIFLIAVSGVVSASSIQDIIRQLKFNHAVKAHAWDTLLRMLHENSTKPINPATNNNLLLRNVIALQRWDFMEILINDPRVDSSIEQHAIFRMAASTGRYQIIDKLLKDPKTDPRVNFNSPIQYASLSGFWQVVELLLADGRADPAANHNFAIRKAASNGHVETVKVLLRDPRVNAGDMQNEALRHAAGNNHWQVVELLLGNTRVDPHAMSNDALFQAIDRNAKKTLRVMMKDERYIKAAKEMHLSEHIERILVGYRPKKIFITEKCPVCLEKFDDEEFECFQCGHVVCEDCKPQLEKWGRCPMCMISIGKPK